MIDINDNHRRKIGITLGMLDALLCDIEIWIEAGERRSAMYHRTCRLTTQQIRQILQTIPEMRRIIADIQKELNLEPQRDEVATMIWSQASCFWESLVELEGSYLRGYGEPSPELDAFITPRARELNDKLQQISRAVSKRASDGST